MDVPIDLPPELQEVEDELQKASKRGDWEACKALVNRLAAEAEFGRIVVSEVEPPILKIREDMDVFPELQETTQFKELMEMSIEGKLAKIRHIYAIMRLGQLKRAAQ